MTQCPEHPHTLGATTTDCAPCRREATPPTAAFLAAKEALKRRDRPKAAHPQPEAHDLRDTRARIDTAQEA